MRDIVKAHHPHSKFFNDFFDFIKECLYRDLSLSSHMDIQHLTERGVHFSRRLAKQIAGENYKAKLDDELEKFKAELFFRTATLMLAIMTEIDSDFKFDPRYTVKSRLKKLWEKVILYTDIAKEFYDFRYNEISK